MLFLHQWLLQENICNLLKEDFRKEGSLVNRAVSDANRGGQSPRNPRPRLICTLTFDAASRRDGRLRAAI
jgi:hypothetical protein